MADMLEFEYKRLELKLERYKEQMKEQQVALKAANELGDVSENAEIDAARDKISFLSNEIRTLEDTLGSAKIIDVASGSKFVTGSLIRITKINKFNEPIEEPKIMVLSNQEDILSGIIGIKSPLGSAILGRQPGVYSVNSPFGSGEVYYMVDKLSPKQFDEFIKQYPEEFKLFEV